jgi:hypothetical protein
MQSFGKHVSRIETVFSAWSVLKVYRGQRRSFGVEFSIGDTHGKFVEDL